MRPRGVSLPLGNSWGDSDTKEVCFDSDRGSLAWPLRGGGGWWWRERPLQDRDLPRQRPLQDRELPRTETSPGRDLSRQRPPQAEEGGGGWWWRERPLQDRDLPRTEISPVQRPPQDRDLPRLRPLQDRDLPRTETSVGCRTHLAEQFPVPRDNGMKTRIKLSIFSKF